MDRHEEGFLMLNAFPLVLRLDVFSLFMSIGFVSKRTLMRGNGDMNYFPLFLKKTSSPKK